MLISPQTAQGLLADLTHACGLPVDPQELGRCRFTVGDHVFVGDFPLRGYKHKGRWRLDDRQVQKAGIRLAEARSTALFQLATELPAAVLARTLGIDITVAVKWQRAAAGDCTGYAAEISRRKKDA
ncbi:hypothetical protein [Streptomyces sp. NPDC048516]|uniref:hypothetical protein n=1 Tax=Streptomyces sp. NPDC048516 TaxID=3365565 RepID=UPI00370F79D4